MGVEVIGIAEDDFCLHLLLQLPLVDSLNRADRTHGHENRRRDLAVVGNNRSRAGVGFGVSVVEGELH